MGLFADDARSDTRRCGPLDLLVIQPTPFCNLDCSYCYLPFRQSRHRIQPATLAKIFERVFESSVVKGPFTVVWHAGEPLVLPVAFYAEAIKIIADLNHNEVRVDQSLQTNGTLITPEWCRFIAETGLRIGVSIDGPAFLHDANRKTRTGRGTHANVLRGIRQLQDHGISFHVITVLTREALAFPEEMFKFFCEHRVYRIGFNVEEIEGPHRNSSLQGKEAHDEYLEFMSRFYDYVQASELPFAIREFDSVLGNILQAEGRGLPHQIVPMAIISIDYEGNFSTFSPELLGLQSSEFGGFSFGNVYRNSLEDIFRDSHFLKIHADIMRGVEKCYKSCPYFGFCGGGAPVNKLFENGSFNSTETLFCRMSIQAVVDVVVSKLEEGLASTRPEV
jgi:uncharacterized protein